MNLLFKYAIFNTLFSVILFIVAIFVDNNMIQYGNERYFIYFMGIIYISNMLSMIALYKEYGKIMERNNYIKRIEELLNIKLESDIYDDFKNVVKKLYNIGHQNDQIEEEIKPTIKDFVLNSINNIKTIAEEKNEKDVLAICEDIMNLLEIDVEKSRIFIKLTSELSHFKYMLFTYKCNLNEKVDIIVSIEDDLKDTLVIHSVFYPVAKFLSNTLKVSKYINKTIKISAFKINNCLKIIFYINAKIVDWEKYIYILNNLDMNIKIFTSNKYGINYNFEERSNIIEISLPIIREGKVIENKHTIL